MFRKKIFVSFDYENDRNYKFLLNAWDKNSRFDFSFKDHSSQEINSYDIGVIKAALTKKINTATHSLIIIGEHANTPHKDRTLIGYKNWINFEIARSKENNNKLIAVKLNQAHMTPDELLYANVKWAMSFSEKDLITALEST